MIEDNTQLKVSTKEADRLLTRVEQDYTSAVGAHQTRMQRFTRYYRKFRNLLDPSDKASDGVKFSMPLTQWQVYGKWARVIDSIFGEDAEVVAEPVGPLDQKSAHKVSRFMTWRLKNSMRIVNPFAIFLFREILFGRSIAYAPWVEEFVETPDGPKPWYSGPGFEPMWPDDLVVPVEDAQSLHDFSFIIRRYRVRPDDLLRGEEVGRFQGVRENFAEIVRASRGIDDRDESSDEPLKDERDNAEGVTRGAEDDSRERLEVRHWYGWWRPLSGRRDGEEDDLKRRALQQEEIAVAWIPRLRRIISIQRLGDIYPTARRKRPFVEASLVKDGSYWSPGFGELLESIEDESTLNHRLLMDSGELTVGPVIFYRPASGFDHEKFEYEPKKAYPVDDPNGVRVVEMRPNLQYSQANAQTLLSVAERITGVSDQNLGRASDRPNAPRTATGQSILEQASDVRLSLDVRFMREDMKEILSHFWQLEQDFNDSKTFFRVTEEEADGLFPTRQGGSLMEPEELRQRFDFDFKFATSSFGREAEQQRQLALYQLDLGNPLIATNPQALWHVTNRLHRAMGDDRLSDLLPKPPDLGVPLDPNEEWTRMLQGEAVQPGPQDNDDLHLAKHTAQLSDESQSRNPDEQAMQLLLDHIQLTRTQRREKQLMAALVGQLTSALRTNTPQTGGLQVGGQPLALQDLQNTLGELTGGGPAGPTGGSNG